MSGYIWRGEVEFFMVSMVGCLRKGDGERSGDRNEVED